MAENENQNVVDYGTILHGWSFPEFTRHERSQLWYVGAAVIVGILLLYCVMTANILFAFIIIIAYLIVIMFHRSSNDVEFLITDRGVVVNKRFYEYKQLKQFYVIYEPPEVKMLYFEPRSVMSPRIPVSLENEDPIAIRETLIRYIEEDIDREDEPTSEQVSRILKL